MKKILIALLLILLVVTPCFSQQTTKGRLNIEEVDGSPSTFPYKLKVTNGSLTDNGDGTATLTINIPSSPPATSTSPGVAGQITWDVNYIYICTSTNVWKRVPLESW